MVLRTFEYACAMRDLKTAAMLEDLHNRRVSRFGGDRWKGGGELSTAMARLDQVKAEGPVWAPAARLDAPAILLPSSTRGCRGAGR
jgi:hypothetical protein